MLLTGSRKNMVHNFFFSLLVAATVGSILATAVERNLQSIQEKVGLAKHSLERNCPNSIPKEPWYARRQLDESIISTEIQLVIETRLLHTLEKLLKDCDAKIETQQVISSETQCTSMSTLNLTQGWRNSYPGDDRINSDVTILSNKRWFRFKGEAGTRLKNTCPTQYSCGSTAGYWSDHQMPREVGDPRSFTLYESWSSDSYTRCKSKSFKATVTKCSKRGDYVYRIDEKMSGGLDTVCSMK